jgi:hypothetical protein
LVEGRSPISTFAHFFKNEPTAISFRKTLKTAISTPPKFPDHANIKYSISSQINNLQAFFQPSRTSPLPN